MAETDVRSRALAVVGAFVLTLAYGLLLLAAFEPDVQEASARELVARSDDARSFLIADLFFPLIYGVLSPLAQWRFGRALAGGSPPGWIAAAALLLAGAAVCDWTENVLLLSATDRPSEGAVDAAHVVAWPKIVLFVAGALLAIAVLVRAVRELRGSRSAAAAE
jgi:hypothetical protein